MAHTATFNDTVIASSDKVVMIEGNMYFPAESLKKEFFVETAHTSVCGWKGTCNYFTISVNGKEVKNGAWQYRSPKPAAKEIENFVAFYPQIKTK
jgi:uncharacterized protein (DUF427 family)